MPSTWEERVGRWVELTLPKGMWPRPIRLGVMRAGKLVPLELR